MVRPSFNNQTMRCMDAAENNMICPGDFEISCDDVGSDFDQNSPCDDGCDGQVWVTADCREGYYCYNRNPEGGL